MLSLYCNLEESQVMSSDMRQVKNQKTKVNRESRLSQDSLNNLHQIAYHLGDFVWKIESFPDLCLILGLDSIVSELENLITLQFKECTCLVLFYDTTFNIGDYYVSPLVARHSMFIGPPVFPVCFVVHERKLPLAHQSFFRVLAGKVKKILDVKI